MTKRPTRVRHSRAWVKKEIPRIFIPRRPLSFVFCGRNSSEADASIRAITPRNHSTQNRERITIDHRMGRGISYRNVADGEGSVAFYALNVHSEVDRRWKRDKARPFSASSCGRRGGFVRGDRSSSDRRTGDGGGCSSSFLLSSPRGEETKILVDIFLPDAPRRVDTANVRIPYLRRAEEGGGLVLLVRSPRYIYIYLSRNFFARGGVIHLSTYSFCCLIPVDFRRKA